MTTIWDSVSNEVLGMAVQIIILLLGLLFSWLVVQIGNAQKALKEKSKNELLNMTIDRASHLAFTIVTNIEETTAKYLREAVKDGKVSREELVELSYNALGELKNTLGEDALSTLALYMSDVEGYLLSLIETKVADVKFMRQLGVEPPNV